MIEVTYLNTAKIALPDSTPVTKVTINGHDIGYKGQYGDLYFFIMKLDLAQYQ